MYFQHIAISGDLGSGKSSLATSLARSLGMEAISTGAMQRELAQSLGMTTLEANQRAESESEIDKQLDDLLVAYGKRELPMIFDSRMAWHFVPSAFKVHLIVDPMVAAARLMSGRDSDVEKYSSLEDALKSAESRYQSERRRFRSKYGVEVGRLRNYDLVIDTTEATPEDVLREVQEVLRGESSPLSLRLGPRRVIPTGDCFRALAAAENDPSSELNTVDVGYDRPFVFAIRGFLALSLAIRTGQTLIPANLVAEGDEQMFLSMTARQYLLGEARMAWIYDWEDAHGFRFNAYPATEWDVQD